MTSQTCSTLGTHLTLYLCRESYLFGQSSLKPRLPSQSIAHSVFAVSFHIKGFEGVVRSIEHNEETSTRLHPTSASFTADERPIYHMHESTSVLLAPSFGSTNKGSAMSSALSGTRKERAHSPAAFGSNAEDTLLKRHSAIGLPLHLARLTNAKHSYLFRSSHQCELVK
jgi:hypothetical protein